MTQLTIDQQVVRDAAVLEVATTPLASGAKTLQTIITERFDTKLALSDVLTKVKNDIESIVDGDTEKLREMLAVQTIVLDQVFQHCAEQGMRQNHPKAMMSMMNVALRAQVMSRQTAQTIVQLPLSQGRASRKRVQSTATKAKHLSMAHSQEKVG
jgi:hypothetical protein